MLYRTIVADPPWHYATTLPGFQASRSRAGRTARRGVQYPTLSVEEICALPVATLACDDAHLYLWTTNSHLEFAPSVARAWGFEPKTILVWCKAPRGFMGFGAFNICTEYVLFCRRGRLATKQRIDRNWWQWRRGEHQGQSVKPEAFIDLVEQVSPGPYVELFARRHRLGWDVWGDQSANTATLTACQT